MTGIETVLTEIDAVGRDLNRRTFLKGVAAAFVVPSGPLAEDDERFFRRVTATLVPEIDLRRTGIDPVENLRHLLAADPRGSSPAHQYAHQRRPPRVVLLWR